MSNPLLDRYPYPGKFEGEINLTERLWEYGMDGLADEDMGDGGVFGYFMLFTRLDKDRELGHLGGLVAAILSTDDQGFVTATYYEEEETARKVWRLIGKRWEKMQEEIGE